MKKISTFLLCSLWCILPWVQGADESGVDAQVAADLKVLTFEQKLRLCYGDGVRFSMPVEGIGLPKLLMMPGPRGFGAVWRVRDEATAFPCGLGLAAGWNPAMANEMASAVAAESASQGVDILLAPGINIIRDPLGGRTFEYFTEDPFLNARLTVPYVQGVQKVGIAANLKHYVCNNQETNRGEVSANVSERALREIYFPAFRAGVIEGGAWTLMTSANRVNGEFVSDSHFLLTEVLKKEWGFDGLVLTDWCDARSTVKAAMAGLDLSMQGRPDNPFSEPLVKAVQAGEVPVAVIDDKVTRLLRTAYRVNRMKSQQRPPSRAGLLDPGHIALARRVAADGMVLLKNDGILPFDDSKLKTLAVFGPNTDYLHCVRGRAGGSSQVDSATHEVSPLQGLKNRLGDKVKILWEPDFARNTVSEFEIVGDRYFQTPDGKPGLKAEYFNNANMKGKPVISRIDPDINFLWDMKQPDEDLMKPDNFSARWTGFLVAPRDGQYTFLVQFDDGARIFIDDKPVFPRFGTTGYKELQFSEVLTAGKKHKILIEYRELTADATMKLSWKRPFTDAELAEQMKKIGDLARTADACVFFGGLNNVIETEGHDRRDMNLTPGQADMMQAVLDANPRTAIVMINGGPVDLRGWGDKAKALLQAWYGGIEAGNAIASLLFGDVNPSGKLPITFPKKLEDNPAYLSGGHGWDNVDYKEGIFVGYRWYDHKGIEPAYAFGHGLSYTTFEYANPKVTKSEVSGRPVVSLTFDLKNTGSREGAEVAQVYVRDLQSSEERPVRELKGFQKVALKPGETKSVSIELKEDAFQFWSEKSKAWTLEPGKFEIEIGSSSRDLRLKDHVTL